MYRQKLLLSIGIWCLALSLAQSEQVKILSGEIEFIDPEFAEADLTVREEDSVNVVDFNFEFKKDLLNDTMIQVEIQHMKEDKTLVSIYDSASVDRCHFVENREKYPKLSAIYEQLEKYGNVMQTCPLVKGKYSVKGFKFTTNEITSMLPPGNYVTHFKMTKKVSVQAIALFASK